MRATMMQHRTTGRALLALLLSLVIAMRIVAPVGFMPTTSGDAIAIRICDGMTQDVQIALDRDTPDDKHAAADKPCAFASALSAPGLPFAWQEVLPPIRLALVPMVGRIIFGLSTRLAAPPPPAIGPPKLR